jgi:hypothetical protein
LSYVERASAIDLTASVSSLRSPTILILVYKATEMRAVAALAVPLPSCALTVIPQLRMVAATNVSVPESDGLP